MYQRDRYNTSLDEHGAPVIDDVIIWWDDQDPSCIGWAWTHWINGELNGSGPLDDVNENSTSGDLIDAFHDQVNDGMDSLNIDITDGPPIQ